MTYSLKNHENFDIVTFESTSLDEIALNELESISITLLDEKRSLILNLKSLAELSDKNQDFLAQLHEKSYENECSFVICELKPELKNTLELNHPQIAVAPTQIEAIDIVSMEVIERELLNGEDL